MAEAAPQYLDKLSETMGIPREQLKKMASEGKLTAKAVIEATRQMSGYFGDRFKQMPITVGRSITIISNKFSAMIDKMNRETQFIIRIGTAFLTAFEWIESGVNKIIESFGGWDNAIRFVGIAIGVALGAKALAILSAFRAASLLAMLPFLKIIAVISLVALALEDLYVWIQGGDSLIGKFAGNWEDVKDSVIGVASAIAALGGAFLLWKAVVVGTTAALRIYHGVLLAVAAAKRAVIIVAMIMNAVMALNPIGLIVLAVAALIAGLVALVVYWDVVKGWISGFFSWVMDKFSALGKFVSGLFEMDFLQSLKTVMVQFGNMIYKAIFDPVVNAITDAWDAAKNVVSGAWEGAKNFVGLGGTGSGATHAGTVAPAQLAPAAMGAGRPNVQSNTNVTVTVPTGTTAEQATFLQNAAKQSFAKQGDDKLARDLAVYAP
jgi:hypothetical protein